MHTKTLRLFYVLPVLFLCSSLGYPMAKRNSWKSVEQLPHQATFMFMERDMNCHTGQIASADNQEIVLNTNKPIDVLKRSKLLYVVRGNFNDPYVMYGIMYSGRSSWADLLKFKPLLRRSANIELLFSVLTKNRRSLKGGLRDVTDSLLTIRDSFGKETQIAKYEIARVSYIQNKPLSDNQEFDWEELAMLRIFDPILYPRLFHAGDTMTVDLYDASLPDDSAPAKCVRNAAP